MPFARGGPSLSTVIKLPPRLAPARLAPARLAPARLAPARLAHALVRAAALGAVLCFGASRPAPAQTTVGGGDLNPGLHTHEAAMEEFQDRKVGLSLHWGPSSLGGEEISWSRGKEIGRARYDSFYLAFNPTKFDADAWMELAKAGGMRYVMPTSKHHDGFALWDSDVSDYDIMATPYGKDLLRELVDAAARQDVLFGSYYSIIDWYHPDYLPHDHGGPGPLYARDEATPDFERYLGFMKSQLRELVQDYGARVIQLDGEWDPEWNHRLGSDLYLYLRMLNDSVLVNSRVDVGRYHLDEGTGQWDTDTYAGDFDERERMVDWITDAETREFTRSDVPWQAWVTIDQAQWSYNETGERLQSPEDIVVDLVKTVGDGGNYLINLGPRPDGTFVPEQEATVRAFGAWLHRYEDAIYGTRAGRFLEEGKYTSTRSKDGGADFLFVIDPSLTSVTLPTAGHFETGAAFAKTTGAVTYGGEVLEASVRRGELTVALPAEGDMGVRVLRLTRD